MKELGVYNTYLENILSLDESLDKTHNFSLASLANFEGMGTVSVALLEQVSRSAISTSFIPSVFIYLFPVHAEC